MDGFQPEGPYHEEAQATEPSCQYNHSSKRQEVTHDPRLHDREPECTGNSLCTLSEKNA